jgi:hypothetical protein
MFQVLVLENGLPDAENPLNKKAYKYIIIDAVYQFWSLAEKG